MAALRTGHPKIYALFVWPNDSRSEEHTSELQSRKDLVCRLLLEKKRWMPVEVSAEDAALERASAAMGGVHMTVLALSYNCCAFLLVPLHLRYLFFFFFNGVGPRRISCRPRLSAFRA